MTKHIHEGEVQGLKKHTQFGKKIFVVTAVAFAMLLASFQTTEALTGETAATGEYAADDSEAFSQEDLVSAGSDESASDIPSADPVTADATAPADGNSGTADTTTPADGNSDTADTTAPADGNSGAADTTTPADGNSGTADTTTPADGSSGTADTTTPADGSSDTADTTTPADGSSGTADTAAPADGNSGADENSDTSEDGSNIGDSSVNTDTNIDEDRNSDKDTVEDDAAADHTTSGTADSTDCNSADTDRSADTSTASPAVPSPQESVDVNPEVHIQDRSSDAVYMPSLFNRSEMFLKTEEKIKYNTALPLDNIPSFISQEMIIGALKCQDETGFPASVTIAQIIQESGFGCYGPGGDTYQGLSYLAFEYCNLFGIKGTGTAGSVDMRTGEQTPAGEYYMTTAGFRVYNTYTECIEDRTRLLQEVYSDLTANVTDANTFAVKIGSRWATSLTYSQNLISQMERYDLYRLDRMTLQEFGKMIGKFADPCPGSYVTSDFGYRAFDKSFHKGIDLGTNGAAIPTYAAESGVVVTAGWSDSAGNWIVIDHGNGLVTKYMHHSKLFVKEGQHVEKGQQIGVTGTTGNSTGVHLHFQIEENGVAVDPSPYF